MSKTLIGKKIDNHIYDLCTIEQNALSGGEPIYFDNSEDSLEILRHSCAHLMAQAIKALYPEAQFFVGPVVEEGFYYDFNFCYVNYDNPDSIRSVIRGGKRPIISAYLGLLIGGELDTYITSNNFDYYGLFKTSTYYNKFQFLYGFGGGLAFHITPLISIDLGYRIILNTKVQSNHDIVASVRFNF